ncbi:MAG: tRNA adenosine(34) deaminase TadA [Candidatus Latescibacteria bacterium]|nr:tRNA adenosine(34) deaminase TadA [Candidatus Latescibacterota bacterium]
MIYDNDETHRRWMSRALAEAEKALELGEAPVGAIIVKNGAVIGRGGNRVITLNDPTAHAEIIAIGAAAETTGYERLLETTMYVTLEPCPMCAGAIVLARIPRLVFGAFDPKMGACGSIYNICRDVSLNHMVEVYTGVLEPECSGILTDFFRSLRDKKLTQNNGRII